MPTLYTFGALCYRNCVLKKLQGLLTYYVDTFVKIVT